VSNAPSKPVSFSRPKVGYFSNRPRIPTTWESAPIFIFATTQASDSVMDHRSHGTTRCHQTAGLHELYESIEVVCKAEGEWSLPECLCLRPSPRGLRRRSAAAAGWDCGFDSRLGHICLL